MSSVEEDILNWAHGRPAWQRNILKRIARGEPLTRTYLARLAKDFVEDNVTLEEPALTLADLPAGQSGGACVQLLSISSLNNINALLTDQTLSFGEKGVTVVYGDNGSGKSGYARLLKAFVGARHREPILPDAYGPQPGSGSQEATVAFKVNGEETTAKWPAMNNSFLRQAHFYDEACGDDYLNNETEVSYRPSIMHIFDKLVEIIDALRLEVEELIEENGQRRFVLPQVTEGTRADQFLKTLSAQTDLAAVEAFRMVDSGMEAELAELIREETRLKTTDPAREKARLVTGAAQISLLADHLERLEALVGIDAGVQFLRRQADASGLREVANELSSSSFSEEPLHGVGSETWRAMWQAAERFSQEAGYPRREFPATEVGDRCVLCHQTLDGTARDRLQRFREFVHNDVATRAAEAESKLNHAVGQLKNLQVSTPAVMGALTFLASEAKELPQPVQNTIAAAQQAKDYVVERLQSGRRLLEQDWIPVQATDAPRLRQLASEITHRAEGIDDARFQKLLGDTTSARQELDGQMTLSKHKSLIAKEVARLKDLDALQKARARLSTAAVTKESADLVRKYVTEAVRTRFGEESRSLKLDSVTLGDKGGTKGKLLQKPTLIGSTRNTPREVLSEGEQTAAGLAGFFTEIAFDSTKSSVILDDPVSSLDHERRDKVARTVVELGTERQVIVFTHDLIFLGEIVQGAEDHHVPLTERAIERNGSGRPGVIVPNYPWKAKDTRARLTELRTSLDRLKRERESLSLAAYEQACAEWAGKLSETWERIIRGEANKVVDRGTAEVHPMRVRLWARITEADNTEFQTGYSAASKWARRHDKSQEANYVPPTIREMTAELERMEGWYHRVRTYTS